MTANNSDSLVSVYKSPTMVEAQIVQEMLVANGLRATVSESEGPFASSVVAPSEVLVWQHDELRARTLIKQAERHHH